MSEALPTWASIIDALGGTGAVAERLEEAASTVSGWRRRGIPGAHWAALVLFASELQQGDVTLEVLAELAARKADAPEFEEARA